MKFSINDLMKGKSEASRDNRLKCSFCGKSQDQVKKLIAGPGVYICDECVDLCNEILDDEFTDSNSTAFVESNKKGSGDIAKDWRGMPDGRDKELDEKSLSAMVELEKLIDYIKAKEHKDYCEPTIRALLYLKSMQNGEFDKGLTAYMDTLIEHYILRNDYHSATHFLEWKLDILEKEDCSDGQEILDTKKGLMRAYMRTGKSDKAEQLLDSIGVDNGSMPFDK